MRQTQLHNCIVGEKKKRNKSKKTSTKPELAPVIVIVELKDEGDYNKEIPQGRSEEGTAGQTL